MFNRIMVLLSCIISRVFPILSPCFFFVFPWHQTLSFWFLFLSQRFHQVLMRLSPIFPLSIYWHSIPKPFPYYSHYIRGLFFHLFPYYSLSPSYFSAHASPQFFPAFLHSSPSHGLPTFCWGSYGKNMGTIWNNQPFHGRSWAYSQDFPSFPLFFPRFSAPKAFFNSTGGLAGHKRSLFEGGVRSPSMVRWPGALAKPGRSSELPWAFWDVLPTVQEGGRWRFLGRSIDFEWGDHWKIAYQIGC